MAQQDVTVRHDLRPGDLGRVIAQHGELYAQEYGLDHGFEAYVAETVAEFGRLVRPGESPGLGRLWLAERDGRLLGSIAIIGREGGLAQLRWLLLDPEARGAGLGRRLLHEALTFCRESGCRAVYLWTVAGLDAAAHLYLAAGFRKTETKPPARLWGATLSEERYDLTL